MVDDLHLTRMRAALEEAHFAAERDEVPIGAVLVHRASGAIAARNGNRTIETSDPSAHAELLVIREACRSLGVQRLPEYDLYVTLEPCPMCAAAISFARIGTVYFGASDPKSGGISTDVAMYSHSQIHHKPAAVTGLLADESAAALKSFFSRKR